MWHELHGKKFSVVSSTQTVNVVSNSTYMRLLINVDFKQQQHCFYKDPTAVVFGEDVAFGGVFRCTGTKIRLAVDSCP